VTAPIALAPRRLGHANLFVGDLETTTAFYEQVVGIELVRREPGIQATFLSNGNTHHDIGLMQCAGGVRLGINGYVQPSSHRGHNPGLNHLGWEINSEADLVAGLERAAAAGLKVRNYANHQLSHSAYVEDPDRNLHEFYADVVEDWRTIFNPSREDLVTEQWDWSRAARLGPMHPDPADRRRIEGAVFHPRRITHATLVAEDYPAMLDFFTRVGGLTLASEGEGRAVLRCATTARDLVLLSARFGLPRGLQGISFEVEAEADLVASERRARAAGLEPVAGYDRPTKRSVLIRDPDGLLVEFYVRRDQRTGLPDPAAASGDAYWAFAA